MKLAILDYSFLFDPTDTLWTTPGEFERTLADYYAAMGFYAEVIPTAGGTGRKVIQITPIDKLASMADDFSSVKEVKVSKPGQVLKDLSSYKTFNGRPRKNG